MPEQRIREGPVVLSHDNVTHVSEKQCARFFLPDPLHLAAEDARVMLGHELHDLNHLLVQLLPQVVADATLDHLLVVPGEQLLHVDFRVVLVDPVAIGSYDRKLTNCGIWWRRPRSRSLA